jgi:hypothetical protein
MEPRRFWIVPCGNKYSDWGIYGLPQSFPDEFEVQEITSEKSYADGIAEGRRLERERIVGMLRIESKTNPPCTGESWAEWLENEGKK